MLPMNSLNAQEIYQFVDRLSAEMRQQGRIALAERLERANKFYLLPLTSEYFGEVMLAFKSVLGETDSLTPELKERVAAYASGIQNRYFPPSPPRTRHAGS